MGPQSQVYYPPLAAPARLPALHTRPHRYNPLGACNREGTRRVPARLNMLRFSSLDQLPAPNLGHQLTMLAGTGAASSRLLAPVARIFSPVIILSHSMSVSHAVRKQVSEARTILRKSIGQVQSIDVELCRVVDVFAVARAAALVDV